MTEESALLAPPAAAGLRPGPRPVFSVVIAAYQAAATIGAAVESVLAQTEPAAEIIVCDDGSTDDLAGALEPFGATVRLLRIPHSGESGAKNTAVAASTAPWVVLLDADDTWAARRLERIADLGEARSDLDLISTDAWFVEGGRRAGRFHDGAHAFPVKHQLLELLRRDWVFAGAAVRREAWDRVGGFELRLPRGADWDCWLRLLLSGSAAGCVAEPLADYTIHAASLSADRSASMLARVEVLDRITRHHQLTAEQRQAAAQHRAVSMRRAHLARAESALLAGRPARASCVRYALAEGLSARQRTAALAAAALPGMAGRRLRRQAEVTGRTRSGRSSATS